MYTDFNNYFTVAFRNELRWKLEWNLPPCFKFVAALLAKFQWSTPKCQCYRKNKTGTFL